MVKYKTRLAKIYESLNKQSPFLPSEQKRLSKRDMNFIRGLQIKDKSSRRDAYLKFREHKSKGPKVFKKLQKDVTSYIKELYPVHDRKIHTESEPKRTGQKLNTLSKTEFNKRLEKIKPSRRTKFKKAFKKYPDASWYELDQGINSKKSQQYRVRHNRPEQYEGRIIK